jgi:hypothetical protein
VFGEGHAAIVVAVGELGVEAQRFAEVGDGLFVALLDGVEVAAMEPGFGAFGVEFERLVEVGQGEVEVAVVGVGERGLASPQAVSDEWSCSDCGRSEVTWQGQPPPGLSLKPPAPSASMIKVLQNSPCE